MYQLRFFSCQCGTTGGNTSLDSLDAGSVCPDLFDTVKVEFEEVFGRCPEFFCSLGKSLLCCRGGSGGLC